MFRRLSVAAMLVGMAALVSPLRAQDVERPPRVSLGIGVERPADNAERTGVVVSQVMPNGPAARAGLRVGDVIKKAGDKSVRTFDDLVNELNRHRPGDKIELHVRRDGKEQKLQVTLARREVGPEFSAFPRQRPPAFLGVQTRPLTREAQEQLPKGTEGALVTEVVPDTPAAQAGLKAGDVITALDGHPVAGPDQLREAVERAGPGKEVSLKVVRGKEHEELKARLGEARAEIQPPVFGRRSGFSGLPPLPGSGAEQQRIQELERQVQELQRRVRDLEQRQGRAGGSK